MEKKWILKSGGIKGKMELFREGNYEGLNRTTEVDRYSYAQESGSGRSFLDNRWYSISRLNKKLDLEYVSIEKLELPDAAPSRNKSHAFISKKLTDK